MLSPSVGAGEGSVCQFNTVIEVQNPPGALALTLSKTTFLRNLAADEHALFYPPSPRPSLITSSCITLGLHPNASHGNVWAYAPPSRAAVRAHNLTLTH